jgi:hypothetical protein
LESPRNRPFSTQCLLLAGIAFLQRLPLAFEPVPNWDESTFLLMGADILEGHLPYQHYWDIKPPLTFLPFAAAAMAGHTVLGLRLLGWVLAAAAGCTLLRIARPLLGARIAWWSSLLLVLYLGSAGGYYATMSEHVAVPLLLLHLMWLLEPRRWPALVLSGVALGAACLVRANLAFACFGSALALVILDGRAAVRSVPLLAAGTLIPVALVVGVYFAAGELDVLMRTNIGGSLAYAGSGRSPFSVARAMFELRRSAALGLVLWAMAAAGVPVLVRRCQAHPQLVKPLAALTVVLASILLSIVTGGRYHDHYLIQVIPFLAIGAGSTMAWLSQKGHRAALVVAMAVPVIASVAPLGVVAKRAFDKGTIFHQDIYAVSRFLNERDVAGQYVYFAMDHIGQWLTATRSPSYLVHPSNFCKGYIIETAYGKGATAADVFAEAFEKEPRFVVWGGNKRCLEEGTTQRRIWDDYLTRDYDHVASFGKLLVHERRNRQADLSGPEGAFP